MGFTGKLEKKTRTWRMNLYTQKALALRASVITLAVALISFLALINDEETPWGCYVCPTVVCLLWSIWIWYSASRMTPSNLSNWSPPKYPNIFMLKKGLGQAMALIFFSFLEEKMKGKNEVVAFTLSFGVYLHLLLVMVLFEIREDFDVSAGFLAASFELSFHSSKDWSTAALIVVTSILCALKNIYIGGRSVEPLRTKPKKKRWGSDMRNPFGMETMVVPSTDRYERMLANSRTIFYSNGVLVLFGAQVTLLISFGFLFAILVEGKADENFCILAITGIGWMVYFSWDSSKRQEYVADEDEGEEETLHNLNILLKSVGQVLCLSLFTFLDGYLEKPPIGLVIGFCVGAYMHLLLVMVFLRIKEDMDLVGGFVSAGFGLFFKIAIGWENKVPLCLVTAILVCLKNFLIGGKVTPAVDWNALPKTELYE
ncbi:unnamed protein product [Microthlaspi erraticum]|uniref:Uncharacterized protein n=1 Tax=Microthlaspi erraticum TaxID=1685480 RepID=A0A6D2IEB7_9BRAS|nr:unnamed protein product [Microthlaspi erraticum]